MLEIWMFAAWSIVFVAISERFCLVRSSGVPPGHMDDPSDFTSHFHQRSEASKQGFHEAKRTKGGPARSVVLALGASLATIFMMLHCFKYITAIRDSTIAPRVLSEEFEDKTGGACERSKLKAVDEKLKAVDEKLKAVDEKLKALTLELRQRNLETLAEDAQKLRQRNLETLAGLGKLEKSLKTEHRQMKKSLEKLQKLQKRCSVQVHRLYDLVTLE